MSAGFASKKIPLVMVQISLLLLGLFVVNSWAGPSGGDREEVYLDTCQLSCGIVRNDNQAQECREKFCPNYVNYLFTGFTDQDSKPSLASTHTKEVSEFCATWLLQLIEYDNWQKRVRLNLKKCICAAGKDCIV